MQFFPPGRQKLIRGDIELSPGVSLNATDSIAKEMENIIHEFPEVVTSAINVTPQKVEGFRHGDENDVSIKIVGEDLAKLKELGGKALASIKTIPDLKDFDISVKDALPEVEIIPNRAKISDLGLDTRSIANTLQTSIDGEVASTYWDKNDEIDIRLRIKDANKQNISFLNHVYDADGVYRRYGRTAGFRRQVKHHGNGWNYYACRHRG